MNYSEMSYFEINHMVAKVSGLNIKCIMLDSDNNHSGVIIGRKNTRERREFNPCNSWADAGPIIQKSKIPLIPFKDDWVAGERRNVKDENPLRAAMIVFLMMKDEEAKNEPH